MSTIEQIKSAISDLPSHQYNELRKWFSETDWELWDTQIERDSQTGKLNFLIEEANEENASDSLKAL